MMAFALMTAVVAFTGGPSGSLGADAETIFVKTGPAWSGNAAAAAAVAVSAAPTAVAELPPGYLAALRDRSPGLSGSSPLSEAFAPGNRTAAHNGSDAGIAPVTGSGRTLAGSGGERTVGDALSQTTAGAPVGSPLQLLPIEFPAGTGDTIAPVVDQVDKTVKQVGDTVDDAVAGTKDTAGSLTGQSLP